MSRFFLMVLLLLGGGSALRAQAPLVQWERRLGPQAGANAPENILRSLTHTRRNRLAGLGYVQNGNTTTSALWLLNNRGDSLRTVYKRLHSSDLRSN